MKPIKYRMRLALLLALLLAAVVVLLMTVRVTPDPVLAGPVLPKDDRLALACGTTVVSGGVEVDTSGLGTEWNQYLYSVPAKVKLEPGRTYLVSYDYTITKVGSTNTEFYHVFRTGVNYKLDRQVVTGRKGHKEFTVKLKASDYQLVFGVRFHGAIRIENLRIEEVVPISGIPFSSPIVRNGEYFMFENGAAPVAGGVEVDTSASDREWNQYFYTKPAKIKFEPGKTYRISYDYAVSKVGGEKTDFYHLLRSGKDYKLDKAEHWRAAAGNVGHKEFVVTLEAADYQLIFGVRFKGAIRVENLKIEEER